MQKMCLRCPVYMLCIPEHGKVVCKYAILNIASRWQQCTWLANTSMQHRIKLEHDPQSMQSVLLVFSLLSSSFAIHMYTDTCTNTLMYHTSNNQFSLFWHKPSKLYVGMMSFLCLTSRSTMTHHTVPKTGTLQSRTGDSGVCAQRKCNPAWERF